MKIAISLSLVAFGIAGGRVAAAEVQRPASVWAAKAAKQFLVLEKPTPEDYLDVIAALSHAGDRAALRNVVSKWEARLDEMIGDDEPFGAHANVYLTVAEGWARAGDEAAFAKAVARADDIAKGLEDETTDWYAGRKPQAVAFRDVDRAIGLARASPEKRQAERFIEVAWACAEMRNAAGMRRALDEARAAAEKFLEPNEAKRIAFRGVRLLAISGDLAGAETAASALSPGFRISALGNLAEAHHAAGNAAKVDTLLSQIEELVRAADAAAVINMALNFAGYTANVGRHAQALPLVRLAEAKSARPADAAGRADRLSQLAHAYAYAGDFNACRRLLDEVLALRGELRAARVAETLKRRAEEGEVPDGDPLDLRDEDGLPLRLTMRRAFDDSALSHIAFGLARGGKLDAALALAEQVDPAETENAQMWVVRGAAAAGDVGEASRVAARLRGRTTVHTAARWAGEEFGRRKDFAAAEAWVDSRHTPHSKLAATIGVIEGILAMRFWEPRLGF